MKWEVGMGEWTGDRPPGVIVVVLLVLLFLLLILLLLLLVMRLADSRAETGLPASARCG